MLEFSDHSLVLAEVLKRIIPQTQFQIANHEIASIEVKVIIIPSLVNMIYSFLTEFQLLIELIKE